jgi:prepilin-type processing-associated H-X9-DG protein
MSCHRSIPLTRSGFLLLMTGLGAAPACAQKSEAARKFPDSNRIPKSGSLMYVLTSYMDVRGIWNVDPPDPEWRLITSGYDPQFLLTEDRKTMYLSSAGPHQPYLEILDFTNRGPARSFPYPGPLGRVIHQMARSADDRYLYILTDALPAAEGQDPRRPHLKGAVVIYTFDIEKRVFLPRPDAGPTFDDLSHAHLITEMGKPPSAANLGYQIFDGGRRVLWSGGIYPKTGSNPGGLKWDARPIETHRYGEGPWSTTYRHVRSAATRRNYFLYADGHVAIFVTPRDSPERLREWALNVDGGIDGMAPGHKMLQPSLSADGRLLFVPIQYAESGFLSSELADRVCVYRTPYSSGNDLPYFRKVQDLVFDKPIPPFQANVDGTILYLLDGRLVETKTSRLMTAPKLRENLPTMSVPLDLTVVP